MLSGLICKFLARAFLAPLLLGTVISGATSLAARSRPEGRTVPQTTIVQSDEAVKAYRTCTRFNAIMAESLDFARAYEETFARDPSRRRAIAIGEGEFGDLEFSGIADKPLIEAYKSRMEMIYLTLVLAGPDTAEDAKLFFPASIKHQMERKAPRSTAAFVAYSRDLARSARSFREHLDHLASIRPDVAERIKQFRIGLTGDPGAPPLDKVIEPIREEYGHGAVKKGEPYYTIGAYTLIQENGEMRIVGIRFITRLF